MKTFAIIPAAGSGRRFGAVKQFQLLAGKPLLLYALKIFEAFSLIDGIFVTVPLEALENTQQLLKENKFQKAQVIAGGKERQDSVRNAFNALPPCDIVLVHDGVRPFVTEELIEKSIQVAQEHGACIVGLPAKETIKRVGPDGSILETVDRSTLWNIQTPQTFRYEIFKHALAQAEKDSFLGTDESMLVERTGVNVKVISGSPYNIKVTTPEDMEIAEAFLKLRESR